MDLWAAGVGLQVDLLGVEANGQLSLCQRLTHCAAVPEQHFGTIIPLEGAQVARKTDESNRSERCLSEGSDCDNGRKVKTN